MKKEEIVLPVEINKILDLYLPKHFPNRTALELRLNMVIEEYRDTQTRRDSQTRTEASV